MKEMSVSETWRHVPECLNIADDCLRDLFTQPCSQGLSPPAPKSERRETLVGSGHLPPGQLRTLGKGPLMSRNLSCCLLLQSKRHYYIAHVFTNG